MEFKKPLKNFKKLPEIIKSIKETENKHKNSIFNLGRNPMEIVHGPLARSDINISFHSVLNIIVN
jgi:hypothetical protein